MKWAGWEPSALGYRAAMPGHIDAILELIQDEAAESQRGRR